MIIERKHRLPGDLYCGLNVVSITACVADRVSFFVTPELFTACEEMLLGTLRQYECEAEVYVFMPDHLHMVIRGESETADVLRTMKLFKQRTGFWLSRNHPPVHWQKNYYDHLLRKDEELVKHILYILNNPVRKGIVSNWQQYPFKGSTVHNLDEWDPV